MWMAGGKLVDILTRHKNFFAKLVDFRPSAASECAFDDPFACAAAAWR
jgi:hypothetical protein